VLFQVAVTPFQKVEFLTFSAWSFIFRGLENGSFRVKTNAKPAGRRRRSSIAKHTYWDDHGTRTQSIE
jgi:tRNA U34 5-methylaminomethyl-2-thiouridine-forming methyltransferase MnmC